MKYICSKQEILTRTFILDACVGMHVKTDMVRLLLMTGFKVRLVAVKPSVPE